MRALRRDWLAISAETCPQVQMLLALSRDRRDAEWPHRAVNARSWWKGWCAMMFFVIPIFIALTGFSCMAAVLGVLPVWESWALLGAIPPLILGLSAIGLWMDYVDRRRK